MKYVIINFTNNAFTDSFNDRENSPFFGIHILFNFQQTNKENFF